MLMSAARKPAHIPLGSVDGTLWRKLYGLPPRDLLTHLHVIGVSGSGKSRFLAGLFLALTNRGMACTLIDPHGDLAQLVLAHLIAGRAYDHPAMYERVVFLDIPAAERHGRFLPFNVLATPYGAHTTARNVLEALRRAWPSLDGGAAPNFENLVLAGTFVLIHHNLPLTRLHDVLVDKPWRDQLLASIQDEQVVRFFKERYDRWNRDQPMLIESSLRRIFLLAFSPTLRFSLAQPDNVLAYREILDGGRSVIVNLALGDADARRLLGCLLTVAAEQAALSRADVPPNERGGSHHLIIDEFSEFTAQSEEALSAMLSMTRKYGLYLVMAHQTWSQTSERLQGAMQNVGIETVFRLGRADAVHSAQTLGRVDPRAVKHQVSDEAAADRSHPVFYSLPEQWESWVQAIQDLKPREAYIKQPMKAATRIRTLSVPDAVVDEHELRAVQRTYLERYFRAQADIERELRRHHSPNAPWTTRIRDLAEE